jgi:hypothetical protein
VIRTARKFGTHVIDRAEVTVHERAEDTLIAEGGTIDPGVNVASREPLPVSAETTRNNRITETDERFKRGSAKRKNALRRGRAGVRGFDVKANEGVRGLAGTG